MAAAKNLELKLTITADGKVAVQQLGAVDAAVDGVGTSARQAAADAGSLKGALASLGAAALAREFVQANAALESNALALEAVLGSQQAAADAMAYIAGLADRLGISIADASAQFVSMAAATRGTALEGQQTRDVFESVVNAMAKLGRSSAQTQQALTAVSQMAAKGTVSMEELRGQLGEALPGAIQAMASAMGLTVQELGALIESGDLLAQDALPALARGLDATFGADKTTRVDSLTASVNRLQNALAKSFTEPGKNGLAETFQTIIDFGAGAVTGATQGMVALGKNLGAVGAYAAGAIPSWEALSLAIEDNNRVGQANIDGLSEQQAAAAEYEAITAKRTELLAEEARLLGEVATARIAAGTLPGGHKALADASQNLVDVQGVLAEVTARAGAYEQVTAAQTMALANARTQAGAATGAYTEQQQMLADQMAGLTEEGKKAGAAPSLKETERAAKAAAKALAEDLATASKDATKASNDLKAAQDRVNKSLADQAAEKAGSGWEQAAMAASQAASQLNSGNPDKAISTLAGAWDLLDAAIGKGDASAGITLVKIQLEALSKAAQTAKAAIAGVTGTGASAGKDGAKTDTGTGTTASAAKTVADQFAKPITLNFDVTAAAQKAATTVADAIAAAVTAKLAGMSLSVPVTAIVSVDAGGATVASDLATEAAKRGSKQ